MQTPHIFPGFLAFFVVRIGGKLDRDPICYPKSLLSSHSVPQKCLTEVSRKSV